MIILSVDPHTAYKGLAHGITHYCFKNEHCVVHINRESQLINHLPREHLLMMQVDVEEVPVEKYLEVAAKVLLHLGFLMTNVNPIRPVRRN